MGVTNQPFLPALILTGPGRRHTGVPLSLLQLGNRYGTSNGITHVDWPKELKHQLTCNVIQIAAHLGRQGRREQALNHQTALFIWNHVMYPLITREPTEESDIFFSERPFPGKNISNVYHLCSFLCTLTCRSLSLRRHWPFRLPGQNDVFCPAHQGGIAVQGGLVVCFCTCSKVVATLPIRTRFDATAATAHGTPRPRTVLGGVVERLLTSLVATGFEPRPGAIGHLCKHDCQDPCESTVPAGDIRFEDCLPAALKMHREGGITGKVIERAVALGPDRRVVFARRETSYDFTNFQNTANGSPRDRRANFQNVLRPEPAP